MFAPVRWLIGLVVCLVVIGFCRGWFTITKVRENAAGDKVNLSVSVDTKKVEADAEKVKHRIEGEVVKGDKEAHNKVRDNMVRGEQAHDSGASSHAGTHVATAGIEEMDGQDRTEDRPHHRHPDDAESRPSRYSRDNSGSSP